VPLIAETGGINAMIVDSTALPEQVADDVVTSAFDSAGQRCSALRAAVPAGRRRRPHDRDARRARWPSCASAIPTISRPTSAR
jgi:acyl-CoA reductase-like NAD-dependent aldehyde dehydrogenase